MAHINSFQQLLLRLQRNCMVYYIEGAKDIYFGRNYSGAFLPYSADDKSPYGLYYITCINKFFYRQPGKSTDTTRLLLPVEEKEFQNYLMATIVKVISTKADCENEAVKLPMAGKKPAVQTHDFGGARIPAISNRFLVLKGWKENNPKNEEPPASERNYPLGTTEGNFIYSHHQPK